MDDALVSALLKQAVSQHKGAADDIVLEDVREVKAPSSILPPAGGRGVYTGLYETLFTNCANNPDLQLFLPHTVVFTYGRPSAWYSTLLGPDGKKLVIRKRRSAALKKTLILHTLLQEGAVDQANDVRLGGSATPLNSRSRPTPCSPFVAVFVSTAGVVTYLDEKDLKEFVLLKPSEERDGVLQQLVVPHEVAGSYDNVNVRWAPSVCCVDRRRAKTAPDRAELSRRAGKEGRVATLRDFERVQTFNGAQLAASTECPVTSRRHIESLATQGSAIAAHFTDVMGGRFVVDTMHFTGRLTSRAFVFMWAENVCISEVVPVCTVPHQQPSDAGFSSTPGSLSFTSPLNGGLSEGTVAITAPHDMGAAGASTAVPSGEKVFELCESRLRHILAVSLFLQRAAKAHAEDFDRHKANRRSPPVFTLDHADEAEASHLHHGSDPVAGDGSAGQLSLSFRLRPVAASGVGTSTRNKTETSKLSSATPAYAFGTCDICQRRVPVSELEKVSYGTLLAASDWAPAGKRSRPRRTEHRLAPFTAASFVPIVEKIPRWARRPSHMADTDSSLLTGAQTVPAAAQRGVPKFLLTRHPLITAADVRAYENDKSFQELQVALCTECCLSLTSGLRAPEVNVLVATCDDDDVAVAAARHSSSVFSPQLHQRAQRPLSRLTSAAGSPPRAVIAAPSPMLQSPAARPASSSSHQRAVADRLSMPSSFLGRPSSRSLVTRVRNETRLLSAGVGRKPTPTAQRQTSSATVTSSGPHDEDVSWS